MAIRRVTTYSPVWENAGRRVLGFDEDLVTLAVEAGRPALWRQSAASRVVVVCREPEVLEGFPYSVVALGLGLPAHTPVELRLGGAVASLDAISQAVDGTLVIGVDLSGASAAGAALMGAEGAGVAVEERIGNSIPVRVRRTGQSSLHDYGDVRLERDRAWRPAVSAIRASEKGKLDDTVGVGPAPKDVRALGLQALQGEQTGAAAPFLALAQIADSAGGTGSIVAIETGDALLVRFSALSSLEVERVAGAAVPAWTGPTPPVHPANIPISMPAFERALTSKVTLSGGRCVNCGHLSFPPRSHCLGCGADGPVGSVELPRSGTAYSVVTVHAEVPGLPGPYSLAIVELDGVGVRVLVHVTDSAPGSVTIGMRGMLRLRRVAIREGVADYGYGFVPISADANGAEAA